MNVHVKHPEHPIAAAVNDFAISGEGFALPACGPESTVVLTHDRNIPSLAWSHELDRSGVLCWQSGHDASVWTKRSFKQISQQGIEWLLRRRYDTSRSIT